MANEFSVTSSGNQRTYLPLNGKALTLPDQVMVQRELTQISGIAGARVHVTPLQINVPKVDEADWEHLDAAIDAVLNKTTPR